MEPWNWIIAAFAGAAGQFVDSAAGMGFGALSSSVLIAGGVAPSVVVGVVSLAKLGGGPVSALAHWRMGNVRPDWVIQMAIPGIVGGILSALLLTQLPIGVVRIWVPLILAGMGILVLRRALMTAPVPQLATDGPDPSTGTEDGAHDAQLQTETIRGGWLPAIGFVAGYMSGFSGTFGPIATTALMLKTRDHPRYVIGSVNAAEPFVALAVFATIVARLDWSAIGWSIPLALFLGGLLTAPAGAYMAGRLPARMTGVMLALGLISLSLVSLGQAVK